ncbi:hypothetical protein GCM10017667_02260 [Streptomyces filamentosus]|uniref:Uncharacterized protein n=1 Tax=Streptomyces filamentosus TaxID=67294 RepID=A0A919EH21_STRFL|nr:hypothetical protein GCM10017667_02260 [Streptomyces filamentosus]
MLVRGGPGQYADQECGAGQEGDEADNADEDVLDVPSTRVERRAVPRPRHVTTAWDPVRDGFVAPRDPQRAVPLPMPS